MKKSSSTITAKEFDLAFEQGEDITPYLDLSNARRPGFESKKINITFPKWMLDRLDRQASYLGVSRQSIIKLWIAQKLKEEADTSVENSKT